MLGEESVVHYPGGSTKYTAVRMKHNTQKKRGKNILKMSQLHCVPLILCTHESPSIVYISKATFCGSKHKTRSSSVSFAVFVFVVRSFVTVCYARTCVLPFSHSKLIGLPPNQSHNGNRRIFLSVSLFGRTVLFNLPPIAKPCCASTFDI